MGLKERLENNIFIIVIAVGASVSAATYGVVDYFSRMQVEDIKSQHVMELKQLEKTMGEKIETIESRVTSVERKLGDQKYLDVQKFFTAQPVGGRNGLRSSVAYNSSGHFFAPKDFDTWKFVETNEADLMSELSGMNLKKEAPQFYDTLSKFPISIWRGGKNYVFDEDFPLKKLFPFISVETLEIDRLPELLGKLAQHLSDDLAQPTQMIVHETTPGGNAAENAKKETHDGADKNFTKIIQTSFRSDAVGTYFAEQMDLMLALANINSHVTFSMRNVQKIGPVMYAQIILKLSDVMVNKRHQDQLFLVKELYVIARNQRMTVVQTNVISDTPAFTGGDFNDTTLWLGSFYIADD